MTFEQRRDAAFRLMDAAGVKPGLSRPPLWRLLWRLGVEIPPPLFMSGWGRALFSGLSFAVFWGALMWLLIWRAQEFPPMAAIGSAVFAGLLFGAMTTAVSLRKRRKLGLPPWGQL